MNIINSYQYESQSIAFKQMINTYKEVLRLAAYGLIDKETATEAEQALKNLYAIRESVMCRNLQVFLANKMPQIIARVTQ